MDRDARTAGHQVSLERLHEQFDAIAAGDASAVGTDAHEAPATGPRA